MEIGNGINFREFALVMWNFLSLHEEAGTTLPDFVYFIKDQKGNGILLNKSERYHLGMHGSDGEIVDPSTSINSFTYSTTRWSWHNNGELRRDEQDKPFLVLPGISANENP